MRVYFAHAPAVTLIKIGVSVRPEVRVHDIDLLSPVPVVLLGTTNRFTEAELHERFASLRHRGEWFVAAGELLSFIREETSSPLHVEGSHRRFRKTSPIRLAPAPEPVATVCGPELLRAALSERGLTHVAVEESIGATRGVMSRWLNGERRPRLRFAVLLEQQLGIPLRSWVSKPTVDRLADTG